MDRTKLEELYEKYNDKKYIHPDPLEFLYNYEGNLDREVVGLIASSLAYGKVTQILKSVTAQYWKNFLQVLHQYLPVHQA